MSTKIYPINLLLARARLRKALPLKPSEPDGGEHFNHISLEGYLFAILSSPLHIGPEIWGASLEEFLPETLDEEEDLTEDILLLYADMEDALAQSQPFRVHTLNLSESIPPGEAENHPLNTWVKGFATGYRVIHKELDRMTNWKKNKKNKKNAEIRSILQEYKDHVTLFYAGLNLRMNPEPPKKDDPDLAKVQAHILSQSLKDFFNNALQMMCEATEIAALRLSEEL